MSDVFMGARAGVIVSAGTTSIADRFPAAETY